MANTDPADDFTPMEAELVRQVREVNSRGFSEVAQHGTCLWCRDGEYEIGAHHAANCQFYRSPFAGPDANYWDRKLRQFFQDREPK